MSTNDLRNRLMEQVYKKAEYIIEERAKTLQALIKYEIAVINTELAMRSNQHGYDFKFLSDSYANNIILSPTQTDSGSVSIRVTIPNHAYKDASNDEVAFFKEYVLANALQKLRRGS